MKILGTLCYILITDTSGNSLVRHDRISAVAVEPEQKITYLLVDGRPIPVLQKEAEIFKQIEQCEQALTERNGAQGKQTATPPTKPIKGD